MKNRLFSFVALLILSFGTIAVRAQQQQQSLPSGFSVVELSKDDQKRLTDDQKDAVIMNLRLQVLNGSIATAQAQAQALQAEYNTWLAGFGAEVDAVRAKNKFGSDVNFDFQRMQFIRGPKPGAVPATPADKKAEASAKPVTAPTK